MSYMFNAVGAFAILAATPVIAQDMPSEPTVAADPAMAPPATGAPATEVPVTPAPSDAVTPIPASPAPEQTKAEKVAAVVDAEFPSYDADKDGDLTKTEFTNWMTALRKQSDETAAADSAKTKKWVNDAFAAADADKSKKISKTEMSSFLLG